MSGDPLESGAVPAGRMTPRYLKKREAILHAAAQLFNQRGVKGATLCDVAGQVGLSTNSITYYYKKKEDLVVACLLRTVEAVDAAIAQAAAPAPEERVRRLIALFFARMAQIQSGQAAEMMTFRDVQVLGDPHAGVVYAAYTEMFRRCRRLLANEAERAARRVSLNARTHLLLSLMLGAMAWISQYDPEDFGRVAERVSDILIGGLAADGSRWTLTPLDARLALPADKAESTQAAFLRAASALINEQGYRGASVDRISARLNLTKGSLYHHHPSKEELISECFERNFRVMRTMQMIALGSPASGWDKLCAVSRGLVRYQFSEQGPLLRMSAWSELPRDVRDIKLNTVNQLRQRFVSFMVDGMQDGSIRAVDQSIAGYLVGAMINAAVVLDRWVPDVNADNAVESFARPLFMGLLSDRG
jgi:AcrR family transcriptional regulator